MAEIAKKGDHLVSYDLKSGYYHVVIHPVTQRLAGIKWEGVYYVYTCLPFGLSTTPWVFFKVMREIVMFFKEIEIRVLPYFDDLFFPKRGVRTYWLVK